MLVVFYKNYPYAPKSTALSALCTLVELIALLFAVCLIAMFGKETGALYHKPLAIVGGVALALLAVACYVFAYRKAVPAMAEKETEKNIRTKAKFARLYCQNHPEAFEELQSVNAAFAQMYTRDESGRIVKKRG